MKKVITIEGSENDVTAIETALAFVNHLIEIKESRLVTMAIDGMGDTNITLKYEDGTPIAGGPFSIPLEPKAHPGYKASPVGQIDGSGNLTVDLKGDHS